MNGLFSVFEAIISASLIAILSGLGVGSGGLLVIWLTLVGGVAPEIARGLNLLFFVFSSGAAMIVHTIKGRIRWRAVISLSLFACLGTFIGTYFGSRMNPAALRKIFGVMLTVVGGYNIISKLAEMSHGENGTKKRSKAAKRM